jgi:hypothetical protein
MVCTITLYSVLMNITLIGGLLMMEIFRRWNVFLNNSKEISWALGYWCSMRKVVCIA